ncbi:cysteine proteinase, partial [Agrocybe pediades]
VVGQILDALGTLPWSDRLEGLTGKAADSIDSVALFASKRWLRDEQANQMLDLLRRKLQWKREETEVLSTWAFEKMKEGYHSQERYKTENSFRMLRIAGDELGGGKICTVGFLVNVNKNHWVAVVINGKEKKLYYGDSLRNPIARSTKDVLTWWTKYHTGTEFTCCSLPITIQEDSFSCGIFALNALTAYVLDGEELLLAKDVTVERLRIMKDLLYHH